MTPHPTRTRLAVLAAVVASMAVVAGCSSDTTPTDPSGRSAAVAAAPVTPDPSVMQAGPSTQPDRCAGICTADAVTVAGLTTLFSYRGTDPDPADAAAARAAEFLDPTYRRAVGTTWAFLAPVTGSQWARWAATATTITAAVTLASDNHPATTAQRTYRQATITLPATTTPPFPVWVVLTAGGPHSWQISSITTQQ